MRFVIQKESDWPGMNDLNAWDAYGQALYMSNTLYTYSMDRLIIRSSASIVFTGIL